MWKWDYKATICRIFAEGLCAATIWPRTAPDWSGTRPWIDAISRKKKSKPAASCSYPKLRSRSHLGDPNALAEAPNCLRLPDNTPSSSPDVQHPYRSRPRSGLVPLAEMLVAALSLNARTAVTCRAVIRLITPSVLFSDDPGMPMYLSRFYPMDLFGTLNMFDESERPSSQPKTRAGVEGSLIGTIHTHSRRNMAVYERYHRRSRPSLRLRIVLPMMSQAVENELTPPGRSVADTPRQAEGRGAQS